MTYIHSLKSVSGNGKDKEISVYIRSLLAT